jgi:outer membrane protein
MGSARIRWEVGRAAIVAAVIVACPAAGSAQSLPADGTVPLRAAIQEALANSPTVADAEYSVDAARQQVREAWASALPDIAGTLSYSRNLLVQEIFLPADFFPGGTPGDVRPIRVGSDNTWQLGLTLTQPLFQYEVFVGVGAASRYQAVEEERLRGTTQEVVTAVRQAYFDALLSDAELRLLEQSIDRVRRTLEESRALNQAGLASDYDVLRLEVEYANVAANLTRAQNAVAARTRSLLVEMGLPADGAMRLEGRLDDVVPDSVAANTPENVDLILLAGVPGVLDRSLEDLLAVAESERSDLRQLRGTILLEEARKKLEIAQYFPKLSLFGNFNIQAQENGSPNFFGENANQRTKASAAGLRLEVPIFQGFRRSARAAQAEASVRQNEVRLGRAEQDAQNQIRTLFDAVGEALDRARSQHRAVQQATRGFEIASLEYREGIGSQLQVTDAEEALRQSQFNYARAIYDFLSARAQLELAMGSVPEAPDQFPVTWAR